MSKTKDVLIRALKTLWQASVAYLLLNAKVIADAIATDLEVGGFETIKSVGMSILLGAVAAGLSAVYNAFLRDKINPNYAQVEDDTSEDEIGIIPSLQDEEEEEIEDDVLATALEDEESDSADNDGEE